jgi:hypothetical protein
MSTSANEANAAATAVNNYALIIAREIWRELVNASLMSGLVPE